MCFNFYQAEYVTFKEIYLHQMEQVCLDKVTKNKCLHLKNNKHLNLHKEWIDLQGGGHTEPPRFCRRPERGPAQGYCDFTLTSQLV